MQDREPQQFQLSDADFGQTLHATLSNGDLRASTGFYKAPSDAAALVDLLMLLQGSRGAPESFAAGVERLSHLVLDTASARVLLDLPASSDASARHDLIAMSQVGIGDTCGVETVSGVRATVSPDGRARFIRDGLELGDFFSIHMLLGVEPSPSAAFTLALRLLRGAGPEEPVLSAGVADVLIGNQYREDMSWTVRPRLLGVHVCGDRLLVMLDGVPVWFAPRHGGGLATGFNLDLLGVSGGDVALDVHWVGLVARDHPLVITPEVLHQARARLAHRALRSDVDAFARLMHAFRDLPLVPEDPVLQAGQRQLVTSDGPYRSHLRALLPEVPGPLDRVPDTTPAPVISVDNISVQVSANAAGDKSLFGTLTGRKREKIQILKDVSFDVYPGDIVGILGKNGAGKTTLLHTLIGAIPISSGIIRAREKPVLLRPGAGMQAELTGRENIFQAGLYMGLSTRDIRAIIDDVIAFSELGEHINRPYQYYSDGMRSRLIFSMATAVSPTILMLDELLSAGDIGFQKKAMRRLDSFIEKARVVLVVQHGLDFVLSRCTKCLYLNAGRAVYYGDPKIAAELYQGDL
ncbi:MAG: ATP-binding cassette domain-containing protein [Pseudomonadota bacterium]